MPIRDRLIAASQFELVQDLPTCASEKYLAGLELMVAGRGDSGAYLMGYSAEMLLKYAYFRIAGARINDPVQPLLRPALQWGRTAFPQLNLPSHDGFHSIGFWAMLLWLRRQSVARPLPQPVAGGFAASATWLNRNWWVEMRYRTLNLTSSEVHEVYRDATWLLEHASVLWS